MLKAGVIGFASEAGPIVLIGAEATGAAAVIGLAGYGTYVYLNPPPSFTMYPSTGLPGNPIPSSLSTTNAIVLGAAATAAAGAPAPPDPNPNNPKPPKRETASEQTA